MPIKYYVLPEERKQMQEEAVKRATSHIGGPVAFYERWPGEEPRLMVTDEVLQAWRPFCILVWQSDAELRKRCALDYEDRAANCTQAKISLCWLGVHNAICPVRDEYDGSATLIGGEFLVYERKAEAEKHLEQFLATVQPEQVEVLREAWHRIPVVSEEDVFQSKIRELDLAGRNYLYELKRLNDFRYSADLATHNVVIALQALIADIEVLKIDLKGTFNIGKKWEKRFEALIQMCEEQNTILGAKLDLNKPNFAYDSINRLLHECAGLSALQAKSRGIEFQFDLEKEIDEEGQHKVLAVRMDRVDLRQALHNVLDNAVKYSFSGTAGHPRWVEVTGRLQTVRGVPGYNMVMSNLGIGIEEDELELVFEPGYQGKRRLEESRAGYGMGLTSVKKCVEKHGGSVTIRSQPQQRTGWLTTVSLWLPLHGPVTQGSKGG